LYSSKEMENLELCDCGKVAVWCYIPGFKEGSPYFCNDCISSPDDAGCSCNWHYSKSGRHDEIELPEGIEGKDFKYIVREDITKEDGIWIHLDEKGRPYPCAEYCYSEEGFEKD